MAPSPPATRPMKGGYVWLLMGACLVAQGCRRESASENHADSAPQLTREAMIADLNQYHDMVAEGWAYRTTKRDLQNVDISAVRDRLVSRVSTHTSNEQFAELLHEFDAALEDGHARVDAVALEKPLRGAWPVGFGIVREVLIVMNLNWLPDNPGVRLGDRLVRVNGEPIDELVNRTCKMVSASTDGARRELAVDRLHRTNEPSVSFSLDRSDGSSLEVTLPCLTHPVDFRFRERKTFCEHRELESGIHLIRIPQFTWNEAEFSHASTDQERETALMTAKSQIDDAFVAAANAQGVVLDLRGNAGGYELLSSYVAEHLVAGDFLYYTLTRRDSELVRALKAYATLDGRHFGVPLLVHPRRWTGFRHSATTPYVGRLVVLINARCFSTTDNLCAFLKDSRPDVRFVGQPTGGGTGEPMTVGSLGHSKVPIQFCVSIVQSPEGRMIEGFGTTPDVAVESTRDDALHRRDAALAAAVQQFANW